MTSIVTRKRKAVSPVIATVILIAVAVALGIAVAFWASGLTSSFSKYEKLGVNTQYAIQNTGTGATPGWIINLGGQNTGSSDATITQIQINGVPYTLVSNANTCSMSPYKGSSSGTSVCWGANSGSISLNPAPTSGTAALSVPSGNSFQIELYLSSANPSNVAGKTFSSGQTVQVTIITAAGNNYPASIVLP